MPEKIQRPSRSDQLSLPIEWWQSFADDPETIRIEQTIDELAVPKPSENWEADHLHIRRLQIELASRALAFYGVNKISRIQPTENAYQFEFEYGGHLVDTFWYNHKSLSVKTWRKGIGKPERLKVWKFYDDELENGEETTYDPMLLDMCAHYGFRNFTLRTSAHQSHLQTRHALPAALHLIDMPIADGYPILGPGQDDIEVCEPGKIISRRGSRDTVWELDDSGAYVNTACK